MVLYPEGDKILPLPYFQTQMDIYNQPDADSTPQLENHHQVCLCVTGKYFSRFKIFSGVGVTPQPHLIFGDTYPHFHFNGKWICNFLLQQIGSHITASAYLFAHENSLH